MARETLHGARTKLSARVRGGYEYCVDTDMHTHMHTHMDRPLAARLVSRRRASPRSTGAIYSTHNHTLLVHLVLDSCPRYAASTIFLPIIWQKNLRTCPSQLASVDW
jgi:hypothetical protein